MSAALLTPLVMLSLSADPRSVSDQELLQEGASAYRAGLEAKADSEKALPHFAEAALAYDELWRRGRRHPRLALARARAHFLAGQVGPAIQAYRQGLLAAPDDAGLRSELDQARQRIVFPAGGSLAEQAKFRPSSPPWQDMSAAAFGPWMAVLYCAGCLALARAWMKRHRGWARVGAALLLGAVLIAAGIWQTIARRDDEQRIPYVVIDEPGTALYGGNGEHYPPRIDRLPPGVECRLIARRGGWLQVQLAAGSLGWLPASKVLFVNP